MQTSDQIDQLATALSAFQAEVTDTHKDKANEFLKSKYADLASVLATARHLWASHGLSVTQWPDEAHNHEHVAVITMLAHSSGQWIRHRHEMPYGAGKGVNPAQAYGSALTYLRRYSLAAALGITQTDDDAASTGETASAMPELKKHVDSFISDLAQPPRMLSEKQLGTLLDLCTAADEHRKDNEPTAAARLCAYVSQKSGKKIKRPEQIPASLYGACLAKLKTLHQALSGESA